MGEKTRGSVHCQGKLTDAFWIEAAYLAEAACAHTQEESKSCSTASDVDERLSVRLVADGALCI